MFLGMILSILCLPLGWNYPIWIMAIALLGYITALGIGTLLLCKDIALSLVPGVVLALATIHFSWGGGFWLSLIKNEKARSVS
jgi:hypothetical protein